jgi:hypothetical protein
MGSKIPVCPRKFRKITVFETEEALKPKDLLR